ncbi:MAG: EAL domain-containing protein [Acidimicrobiales bacterium]
MITAGVRARAQLRLTAIVSVMFVAGFSVFMVLNPAGARASVWVDDGSTAAVALAAFLASAAKARSTSGRHRSGWTWIAAGTASWTIGECIWDWYALVRVEPVPSPSVADVFYLLGVPLAVVGIVLLAASKGELRSGLRLVLDGIIITGSLLFISWSTALGVVYRLGGGPLLSRVVDLAYPATDIIMTTAALAALSRVSGRRRYELGLIGAGLLAFSVADSAYSYFTYTNTYGNGNVFDVGYVVGYLCILLAALVPSPQDDGVGDLGRASSFQTLLPYIPLGLAAGIAAFKAATGARFDGLLVATGFITITTVLVRQLLTLNENTSLADRLQATISELRVREAELAHQVSHDPLTGLANRVLFTDRIERALDRQLRSRLTVSVMVCDLDEFKSVNDTLGHLAGDEVLRVVAQRLTATTRRVDTIARLGGDEFGVLLEDLETAEVALETAERITKAILPPLRAGGQRVVTSTSIGIAIASEPGDTSESLLRAADVALYEAKATGKSCYRVFDSEMLSDVFARISLKNDLLVLADHPEQLEIHYQPIVDVRSGHLTGVEALVRWRHPTIGLLYPDAFIQSAEENGTIVLVGAAVLDLACAQFSSWRSEGFECSNLAVNVSARQLRDPSLVATVRDALARHAIPPGQLTLEVTESIMLHEGELAIGRLRELKALGVLIAVDDFGTGYSSLEYLRRLPVDILKIDRTFTNELDDDDTTVVLIDLMTQLAHALGLRTVVEGIETPSQMHTVKLLSCDHGQGFLIARPALPAVIEPLLEHGAKFEPRAGLVPNAQPA